MPSNTSGNRVCCPHCSAEVGARWKYCWLCNQPLPEGFAETLLPPPVSPRDSTDVLSLLTRLAGGAVAVGVTLVAFSLFVQREYGGLIGLLLILVPPGLYTLVRAMDAKRSAREPQTALHHAGVFLSSLAVTLATLAVTSIALAIALFVACLAICSLGR